VVKSNKKMDFKFLLFDLKLGRGVYVLRLRLNLRLRLSLRLNLRLRLSLRLNLGKTLALG
jgi:hypothetical protein